MRKYGFAAFLILISFSASAQRYILQNTGTLYDSFENPAQRAFIPDSSRYLAFNFLIPNGGADIFIKGNAQGTIKTRLLADHYRWDSRYLTIGEGNYTRVGAYANEYIVMAKLFGKVGSNSEYGFSIQARADGYARLSDESFVLFDDYKRFPENRYENIFNDRFYHQAWSQISFTYKEDLSKYAGIGIKLSALSGTVYSNLNIRRSSLTIDPAEKYLDISMGGTYVTSFAASRFENRTLYPRFTNPGAAVTFGGWVKEPETGITFQGNVKDLGFIHWRQDSAMVSEFNRSRRVEDIEGNGQESNILKGVMTILQSRPVQNSFTRPIDSRFEGMMSKPFYFTGDKSLIYKPTVILSKHFFDNRFNAAVLNQLTYHNVSGTISTTIDNNSVFAVGGQFMIKSPNVDFFIGSESLYESYQGTKAIAGSNTARAHNFRSYSGASFFFGFAAKFGNIIETPPNASYIPMGEKGFFGKLWNRWFKAE
ncbi:MAG: hypothetical protein INR69_02125 [Mucilaginibacter polytrichastri]|nr:hypothetical protein [Mucilaginibacter polytrichastri]